MKVSNLKIDQTIEINGHQYQYKGVTKERIPGIGSQQVILFEGVSKGSAPRKTFALTVGNKDLKVHDDGKIEFK